MVVVGIQANLALNLGMLKIVLMMILIQPQTQFQTVVGLIPLIRSQNSLIF